MRPHVPEYDNYPSEDNRTWKSGSSTVERSGVDWAEEHRWLSVVWPREIWRNNMRAIRYCSMALLFGRRPRKVELRPGNCPSVSRLAEGLTRKDSRLQRRGVPYHTHHTYPLATRNFRNGRPNI